MSSAASAPLPLRGLRKPPDQQTSGLPHLLGGGAEAPELKTGTTSGTLEMKAAFSSGSFGTLETWALNHWR